MELYVNDRKMCDDMKLSWQCFAEMLIHFRFGKFLPLPHDLFSKGHAEIFHEHRYGSNQFCLVVQKIDNNGHLDE